MPTVDEATGYVPEWEDLRDSFRPAGQIKLLLVGESPPNPETGSFFYAGGQLTREVKKAFALVFPQIGGQSVPAFLQCFKEMGCFLDDVSHKPVAGMNKRDRNCTLMSEFHKFVERLRVHKPITVVGFLKRIDPFVKFAVKQAGLEVEPIILPFPGGNQQNRIGFIAGLTEVLREKAAMQELVYSCDDPDPA